MLPVPIQPGGPPPPICLDVSRLVSRIGLAAPTGIDRVELAWLRELIARGGPLWLLARVSGGQVLLDRAGAVALAARLDGATPWGPGDWRALVARGRTPARLRAEADMRRLARACTSSGALGRILRRHLPEGCVLLNVGHSNLDGAVFAALREAPGLRLAALIHDTIPLDFPHFQRPGMPARFAAMLAGVARAAALVICNSAHTEARLRHHLGGGDRLPPMIVAHPGLDLPATPAGALPAEAVPGHPRFVTLGTIEPRKNHALLLDLWDRLARSLPAGRVPHLHIVGRRGWCSEAVFRRLDGSPLTGHCVFEHPALPDAGLAALLRGCRALLFPSRAEGFGLPPLEAAAAGVPVVCADLPVWRETLGDYPLRLGADDLPAWEAAVRGLASASPRPPRIPPPLPGWPAHFATVLPRLRALARGLPALARAG